MPGTTMCWKCKCESEGCATLRVHKWRRWCTKCHKQLRQSSLASGPHYITKHGIQKLGDWPFELKAVAIHSWMLEMEPPKGVGAFLRASSQLASMPWAKSAVRLWSYAAEDHPAIIQAMEQFLPEESLDAADWEVASFSVGFQTALADESEVQEEQAARMNINVTCRLMATSTTTMQIHSKPSFWQTNCIGNSDCSFAHSFLPPAPPLPCPEPHTISFPKHLNLGPLRLICFVEETLHYLQGMECGE